jgi:hypothetical protein
MASAETYKQNSEVNIRHPLRDDGALVSNGQCNITLTDPDLKLLVNFKTMSYDSASQTFNYTLPVSNTSKLGDYCYDVTCSANNRNATRNFCFTINRTGTENSTAQSLVYIIMLFLGLIFLCAFTFGAIKTKWENIRSNEGQLVRISYKKHLKILFSALAYTTCTWLAYVSWNISLGYLELENVAYFFRFIFITLLSFALPISIFFMAIFIISFINDLKIQKMIERGISLDAIE